MSNPSQRRLASTLHALIIVGMAAAAIGAAAIIAAPSGLGWIGDGPPIAADASVAFDVDFGETLTWVETDNGPVDAATGGSRAGIGDPVTARFSLYEPSTALRVMWTVVHLLGPLVVFGGLWLVLGVVRSTRSGHPFTVENERRLWSLATLVAVGGTVVAASNDVARNVALQRSAASDLFQMEATFSFLPIVIGIAIGVLAGVWRLGVGMSDDIAGTI